MRVEIYASRWSLLRRVEGCEPWLCHSATLYALEPIAQEETPSDGFLKTIEGAARPTGFAIVPPGSSVTRDGTGILRCDLGFWKACDAESLFNLATRGAHGLTFEPAPDIPERAPDIPQPGPDIPERAPDIPAEAPGPLLLEVWTARSEVLDVSTRSRVIAMWPLRSFEPIEAWEQSEGKLGQRIVVDPEAEPCSIEAPRGAVLERTGNRLFVRVGGRVFDAEAALHQARSQIDGWRMPGAPPRTAPMGPPAPARPRPTPPPGYLF